VDAKPPANPVGRRPPASQPGASQPGPSQLSACQPGARQLSACQPGASQLGQLARQPARSPAASYALPDPAASLALDLSLRPARPGPPQASPS